MVYQDALIDPRRVYARHARFTSSLEASWFRFSVVAPCWPVEAARNATSPGAADNPDNLVMRRCSMTAAHDKSCETDAREQQHVGFKYGYRIDDCADKKNWFEIDITVAQKEI